MPKKLPIMSEIGLKELIDAHAKVARMSVSAIEYKSYLKNLSEYIKAALERNDAKLLLSTAILLPILNIFLQMRTG